jgi:hypothetical protein
MAAAQGNPGSVSACCYQHAVAGGIAFCGDCGKPILRCMAYSECGGLIGEDGRCHVCVSPQLFLDRGAAHDVRAGGVTVLPLIFLNASPIARPLFITKVWVREGDGEQRERDVAWERLDAGASIPWSVQTSVLDRAGRQRLEVTFAAATRYRWREEQFAFVSALELEAEQGGNLVINQTINAGSGGQLGDTIYAPIRLEGAPDSKRRNISEQAAPLALVRGERFEKSAGVRGYAVGANKDAIVARSARLVWRGFAPNDAPAAGPIITEDSLLSMGRARTKADGGSSDVRLLAYDAKGDIDETLSRAISRTHIDLFIGSGRLCLHAAGEAGVTIGDRRVARDGIETLEDGDIIRVLPKYADALCLQVRMRAHYGTIDEVTITRIPAAPGAGG